MKYGRLSTSLCCALLLSVTSMANTAPWRVALVTDMSGSAANGGDSILKGLELAVGEINANGGLLGRPLQIDVVDHRGNPARGLAGLKPLLEDEDLLTVVSGVHSHVALATLPLTQEKPIIMLDPWASADGLTTNDYGTGYVFRVSARDEWVAEFIFSEMEKNQCENVGLLVNLNGWGRSNERAMVAASQQDGLGIHRTEWLANGQERVPELVESLRLDNIDCIALITGNKEAQQIVTTVASISEHERPTIYAHWSILSGTFVDAVDEPVLDDINLRVISTIQYNEPKTERGVRLLSQYDEAYGAVANAQAFHGVAHSYDLMSMFAQAVRDAGSSNQADIRQAMIDLPSFDGVMKRYVTPFKEEPFEALDVSDYILVPITSLSAD